MIPADEIHRGTTFKERPANMVFPDGVELRITSSSAGIHGAETTTFKRAALENICME